MNVKKDKFDWPNWFNSDNIETVVVAVADVYGRLMGKRVTYDYFINHLQKTGFHFCNYLLSVDMAMEIVEGLKVANWENGYGDFHGVLDLKTLRHIPWQEKTAIILADAFHESGKLVEEMPRNILIQQVKKLDDNAMIAYTASELEFYLFDETYRSANQKNYDHLQPASDYNIDYHLLQPGRDETVIGRIRKEMSDAGIIVENSKGETGKGQHEINLQYTDPLEMADRHVIYKMGVKDIAIQEGKSISFMPKIYQDDAGSGCHIHVSVWDKQSQANQFYDKKQNKPSKVFRQFLGGLLKYSRELTYFFAPSINAYKRFQSGSWAPTAIVCGQDNRTCGFRIVGSGDSLRIENRMPSSDANPYLAFAATLIAGMQGIKENLDCGDIYQGNAYADENLPRLPRTLTQAADLLDASQLARDVLGDAVVDFYIHTARTEVQAYDNAVTDWERRRYFEQL
jgi:glutamine synthetase